MRRLYTERKRNGLCIACGYPAVAKKDGSVGVYCGFHRKFNLRKNHGRSLALPADERRRRWRKAMKKFYANHPGYQKKYWEKYKVHDSVRQARVYRERREAGLCVICSDKALSKASGGAMTYCKFHYAKNKISCNKRKPAICLR